MSIEDPVLPAVTHLMGPGAEDVLGAAVQAAGGSLQSARAVHVQYRPGHELVVRYRCDVEWADGRVRSETLLAATVHSGTLPGTVPVVAETDEGDLEVSVWRYPFDPLVIGLPDAVVAEKLSEIFGPGAADSMKLEVVAYRPTERAVVRAEDGAGRVRYIKAVRPDAAEALIKRHSDLRALGLPVPEVIDADAATGLVVLAELPGMTLRERIKSNTPPWPHADDLLALMERIGSVPAEDLPPVPGRVRDAIGHARLLERVAPDVRKQLGELVERFTLELPVAEARSGRVVHGDLHEGQVIVDEDGRITGLLDIDDLGPGDPYDDLATLLAHLRFRAMRAGEEDGGPIRSYADRLRSAFGAHADPRHLDLAVAAVLVGLATGPFRIQQEGWPDLVAAVIDDSRSLAAATVE